MNVTVDDIVSYTGIGITELPSDISRIIIRATEIIEYVTLNRAMPDNDKHQRAFKNAICAQVEYWLTVGEDLDFIGNISSIMIGSFQMQLGNADNDRGMGTTSRLSPRSYQALLMGGLFNRGVRMR